MKILMKKSNIIMSDSTVQFSVLIRSAIFCLAYHLLEEAQEREGCVVGEAVSQVECLLGPVKCHLAYDILQLVVAEVVYQN